MLRRSWIGAAVLLAGLTGPAQGQVKLEWKFKEGDKFYVQAVNTMNMTADVGLQKISIDMDNTTVSSYAVKKATKDATVLDVKIESIKVKSQSPLGQQFVKVFEALKGANFTVTVSPDGKVSKVEGYEEFAKGLKGPAKQLLSEDVLKQGVSEVFGNLPGKEVKKGDTWKREQTVTLPLFGALKVDQEMKYQGPTKEGEEIAITSSLSYMPPKGAGLGGLEITKGEFKADEAKGTILFDAEKGRLVRQEDKLKVKGTLTFKAMGNEGMMTIELDQTSKLQVLDKPPKD